MRYYSNTSVETTLSVDINAVTTSIQIGDTTGLPVTYPYTLVIDYEGTAMEVVTVTSSAGPSLIVTRGQDGTSAQSHTAGALVVHAATARDFSEPQEHIADSQDVHGIGVNSFVVGTEATQTLTNKTISGLDNTLEDISWSSLGGDGAILIDGNTGGQPAITVNPEPGNAQTGILIVADAKGLVINQESGGTGNLLEINSSASATLLTVTNAGLLTVASGKVNGAFEVDGTTTLSHTTVTQDDPNTIGLIVTAHDTPTTPAMRVIADNAVAGFEVRRSNATNLTGELVRFSDQVGATLAQILRNGGISTTTTVAAGTTITAGTGLTVTTGNVAVSSGQVAIARANSTDMALDARVGAEANARFQVRADGQVSWGAGGASAVDTNLYRSGANALKTDDAFETAGVLTIGGDINWGGSTTVSSYNATNFNNNTTTLTVVTGDGLAFVAPPSGMVIVTFSALIDSAGGVGVQAILTFEIKNGATIGSGTVFFAAQDDLGIWSEGNFGKRNSVSNLVTGLTPGNSYNVTLWQKTDTGGTNSASSRRNIIVSPVP